MTSRLVLRVEVAGGLVGENDARPSDEGARDRRDALLLSARQLVRVMVGAVRRDRPSRATPRARAWRSRVPAPRYSEQELDVLERARPRQEVEALEHEAEDLRFSDLSTSCPRSSAQATSRPVEHVAARRSGRSGHPRMFHQRRLAGPGRPHDGDKLPPRGSQATRRRARAPRRLRSRTRAQHVFEQHEPIGHREEGPPRSAPSRRRARRGGLYRTASRRR